jgi:hypothetical protein
MLKRVSVVIPSFKRAGMVKCADYFKTAKICVPAAQEADYLQHYDRSRVVAIPDSEDGNIARKRNAILDRFPRPLLMLDDDVECLMVGERGEVRRMSPEEAQALIIHGFNLAHEWGCVLWGINVNTDRISYQPYKPFSLTSMVLGPFMGHLDHDLRYDERMGSKDDYDLSLSALNKHKRILRLNKYAYRAAHGDNKGGLISMRSLDFETRYCRAIEAKWGRQIIRYPLKPRKLTDLLNGDVNIPIAGV